MIRSCLYEADGSKTVNYASASDADTVRKLRTVRTDVVDLGYGILRIINQRITDIREIHPIGHHFQLDSTQTLTTCTKPCATVCDVLVSLSG
jgi:hypothetical protein